MPEEVVHIALTAEELPNTIAHNVSQRVCEMRRCRDISEYWLREHTRSDLKYAGMELKVFKMESTRENQISFEICYGDDNFNRLLQFTVHCNIEAFVWL